MDIWNPIAEKDIFKRGKVNRFFVVYRDTATGALTKSEPFTGAFEAVRAARKITDKQKTQTRIVKRLVYVF